MLTSVLDRLSDAQVLEMYHEHASARSFLSALGWVNRDANRVRLNSRLRSMGLSDYSSDKILRRRGVRSVHKAQRKGKLKAVEYLGGKCEACGYSRCLAALEFHHRDPLEKDFTPAYIIGHWAWDKVKAELDKCTLLCSNCHREAHWVDTPFIPDRPKRIYRVFNCEACGQEFTHFCRGRKFCSQECTHKGQRKVSRPDHATLSSLLWEIPTKQLADKYGVSDKAVEKWCKTYNLIKPPRGYWSKGLEERQRLRGRLMHSVLTREEAGENPVEATIQGDF